MPARLAWTKEQDAQIVALRAKGVSWDRIVVVMAIGRNQLIERARRIGIQKRGPRVGYQPPPPPVVTSLDGRRDALPAMHPDTWGLLLTLTPSLAGEPDP